MRSQNSVLAHTTKSLSSLTLTTHQPHIRDQHRQRSTTSTLRACGTKEPMTTGSGISGGNSNSAPASQKTNSSTLPTCISIVSNKNHTTPMIIRHSNGNLSSNNNVNTSASTTNNNNIKANSTNNNNQNPNWSKLQTLEQRKLELEKLLNEKNWLLAQIHKQESQILNGNYENFHLFESGKVSSGTGNSILRRKGSSSLKLNKNNVHFNGENSRLTLSKSEYDLAQENKHNNQLVCANTNVASLKKRQGVPLKTNSFHDSTSTSALSLTKSPSFEYNGNVASNVSDGTNTRHSIKYSLGRPHGSNENLTNSISGPYSPGSQQQIDKSSSTLRSVAQCDKYYLSPTSQMYTDGNGFIKASQNIKQCLSPSPMHKVIALNDTAEAHRSKQHQGDGSHNLVVHHNGSQPHLEQYENVDALSLSPSTICTFDQVQAGSHWGTMSSNDRLAWCDATSYVELDNEIANSYNVKPLPKRTFPTSFSGSSMEHSPESSSMGNFYTIGGSSVIGYPTATGDEISISSVNSETNKKPKNKQWMESSLDGPVIRPNILQNTSSLVDANALQYSYYSTSRQTKSPSAMIPSGGGKIAPSPNQGTLLTTTPGSSRPPTRTLTHHSHPHHKQSFRERTKLSSQSMSSGTYKAPKEKLDDDSNHLSHSTSFLNVDPYHHHHFHLQPTPQHQQHSQQQPFPQLYHHNHYLMNISNSSAYPLTHIQNYQMQQKPPKQVLPPSTSPLPKLSPTTQHADTTAQSSSRPSQGMVKNSMHMTFPNPVQQTGVCSTTSPDIRIESPKNMTVVQQATFLPYKEVTKPFEMSDFYKYSTKFRQKEANATKNTT